MADSLPNANVTPPPAAVSAAAGPRFARLTNRVYPPESPGLTSLLGLAVGVVIIAALALAREVLIPITLAVLLSFVLGPIVAGLRRLRLPRVLAVLLAALVALGLVLLLGFVIGGQIGLLMRDIPRYASTIETKVSTVRDFATRQTETLSNSLGAMREPPAAPKPPAPAARPAPAAAPLASGNTAGGAAKPAPDQPPNPVPVEIHTPSPGPFQLAENLLMPVVSPLATAAIVFVVAIFILLQQEDLRDRLIRVFGSNDLHRTTAALDDAGKRLGKYYLSLLAVNTGFGCTIGIGLYVIGVPSPLLWGIMAGMLRFVPYIGAFAGAVLPLLLAAAVDPGWTMVAETAALFLAVEPVLGQIIEPLIYGHSTGLSPVSVVIAAIFWGWIWGGLGLLLSMPLTLCLVVLGKHIKRLEFLHVLLGDKPALSPAESLYQRMLVGDADEVLEQAETLLKERSIVRYYDEVAIPGLQLAANDSLRGVLTPDQLHGIMESICGVVAELPAHLHDQADVASSDPHADAQHPAAPQAVAPAAVTATPGASVLCVSGRGPLDEAAATMLAQLLDANGLRAQVASREAVGRSRIATLDLDGVDVIVVSYLEGDNALTPLRYLVRRLRQRMPKVRIVVGMWAGEAGRFDRERVEEAVGADNYVTTLADAVAACTGVPASPKSPASQAA